MFDKVNSVVNKAKKEMEAKQNADMVSVTDEAAE